MLRVPTGNLLTYLLENEGETTAFLQGYDVHVQVKYRPRQCRPTCLVETKYPSSPDIEATWTDSASEIAKPCNTMLLS